MNRTLTTLTLTLLLAATLAHAQLEGSKPDTTPANHPIVSVLVLETPK